MARKGELRGDGVLSGGSDMETHRSEKKLHDYDPERLLKWAFYFAPENEYCDYKNLAEVFQRIPINPEELRAPFSKLGKEDFFKTRFEEPSLRLYYLDRRQRDAMEAELRRIEGDAEPELATVSESLAALISKVTKETQRVFLEETIRCMQAKAYRAAIVMGWNLAYDHLLHWLLADHARLKKFADALESRSAKRPFERINEYVDFGGVKESIVIDEARKAGLIDNHDRRRLEEGLGKRNRYAHPSSDVATAPLAAGHIDDLLQHVVLAPKFAWEPRTT